MGLFQYFSVDACLVLSLTGPENTAGDRTCKAPCSGQGDTVQQVKLLATKSEFDLRPTFCLFLETGSHCIALFGPGACHGDQASLQMLGLKVLTTMPDPHNVKN